MNGEVVKVKHGRPCLTKDAVPTRFPNTPSYLSKRLPEKRQSRTSREVLGNEMKRMKRNDGTPSAATLCRPESTDETVATDDDPSGHRDACTMDKLNYLKDTKLTSSKWSRNLVAEAPNTRAFSVCALAGESACFQKLVLCSAGGTHYHCSAFVQGATLNLLSSVDEMCVSWV